jgi:hypothetical protein
VSWTIVRLWVVRRRVGDRSVVVTTACLDMRRVDAGRRALSVATFTSLFAAVVVHPHQVEGMKVSRKHTEDCQADVDEKICALVSRLQRIRTRPCH